MDTVTQHPMNFEAEEIWRYVKPSQNESPNDSTLLRFEFDQWVKVAPEELQADDLISSLGTRGRVSKAPHMADDEYIILVSVIQNPSIVLALGDQWLDRQHVGMAMDYVSSGMIEFGDGTAMIGDLDEGEHAFYSPRMTLDALEAFCKENIDRYEAFFEEYEERLDRCEVVPMEPWWRSVPEA